MTPDQPGPAALHSQSAERNRAPIFEVLKELLPSRGTVLEIASGTGQHVTYFAERLPSLTWQPSDPDPGHRESIAAWTGKTGLTNIRPPLDIDTTKEDWGIGAAEAIYCFNMIHIAPWASAEGLVRGAERLLAAGRLLFLYGPFSRGGVHSAPSNQAFDQSLKTRDPSWGVRDLDDVEALAAAHGLVLENSYPMPANNLTVVFRKSND